LIDEPEKEVYVDAMLEQVRKLVLVTAAGVSTFLCMLILGHFAGWLP